MIRMLAQDTSLWSDDVWVVDSAPVGCGCSRETAKRSDLAGWAQYGYCASHSRYFWGLRLHLVCTLGGLPVLFALTGAKADERETLRDMLDTAPEVEASHPGQTIIGDKNYFGREFERDLTERHLELLRPARKGGARAGWGAPVQAAPAGHRVDQPDLQGPARPGAARRQVPGGGDRAGPVPRPRADRRDLAQRQDRPAGQAITDRLRPLTATTPLGLSHLVKAATLRAAAPARSRRAVRQLAAGSWRSCSSQAARMPAASCSGERSQPPAHSSSMP